MPGAAYLTEEAAASRLLLSFDIEGFPTLTLLEISSEELDQRAAYIGSKHGGSAQARAFPRSINADGTENSAAIIPAEVLNYVALRAYELHLGPQAAVSSKAMADMSISYARPQDSKLTLLLKAAWRALAPYRRRVVPITAATSRNGKGVAKANPLNL